MPLVSLERLELRGRGGLWVIEQGWEGATTPVVCTVPASKGKER